MLKIKTSGKIKKTFELDTDWLVLRCAKTTVSDPGFEFFLSKLEIVDLTCQAAKIIKKYF